MPSSDSSPALDPALVAPLEPGENAPPAWTLTWTPDRFAAGRLMLTDRPPAGARAGAAGWQAAARQCAEPAAHRPRRHRPARCTTNARAGGVALHPRRRPGRALLLGLFERQRQRLIHGITEADEPAEAEETDFAAESPTPPSTWVLLRLSRFAGPTAGSCCSASR